MKTKAEFLTQFADELRGLLIAAYADAETSRGDFAAKGRLIVAQMSRAANLMERMYNFISGTMPALPEPEPRPKLPGPSGPILGVKADGRVSK